VDPIQYPLLFMPGRKAEESDFDVLPTPAAPSLNLW
jgi:hypothetical protein